uniref:Migration and invasion enhancer 1 n=1 Tax=Geotrypetes seraphini TaxID=260995 RepID=A0A6P8PPN8_GEOSA|nr:migration and invasion enhancer 1-like [Geotrypetes seraphini]
MPVEYIPHTKSHLRGYESRYWELAEQIKQHVPDAVVSGEKGRNGSFEVKVNEKLIFSKLECCGFPYSEDIIEAIEKMQAGEDAGKILRTHKMCVIV